MDKQHDFWTTHLKEWTVLDPLVRFSEVLFGLIMVLNFTGTISVSIAGKEEVHELIWASLGCNLAWWLIDAIMKMDTIIGRARNIKQLNQIIRLGKIFRIATIGNCHDLYSNWNVFSLTYNNFGRMNNRDVSFCNLHIRLI